MTTTHPIYMKVVLIGAILAKMASVPVIQNENVTCISRLSVDMSNAFNMGKTIHVPTQALKVFICVSSLVIGFTCLYVFGEK